MKSPFDKLAQKNCTCPKKIMKIEKANLIKFTKPKTNVKMYWIRIYHLTKNKTTTITRTATSKTTTITQRKTHNRINFVW